MKKTIKTTALLAAICCGFAACDSEDSEGTNPEKNGNGGTPEPAALNITPIEQLNQAAPIINSHAGVTSRSSLKMNYRSYVELGKASLGMEKPWYPRIKTTKNGSFIMFYNSNGLSGIGADCEYALSVNLKSWSAKGKVFTSYKITDSQGQANERRYANCDGIVLSNGDILAVASYRANSGYRDKPLDCGVAIRRSTDNGLTWGKVEDIYQGVTWEPYLLQLPSGEVQCYFTDSNRTGVVSTDTGTGMLVSKDNGKTWSPSFGSEPYYVIRTRHIVDGKVCFNNQMPSVIKLNNSNELAAAVEANIGGYHISFAYSGEDGEWDKLTVTEEGPTDRNDLAFKGAAPYLVQFPSGETVLSYSGLNLKMGDARARNFAVEPYIPFANVSYWGTLERIDGHQLIGAIPYSATNVVKLAKFVLNHSIEATQRNVNVDGNNAEWTTNDHALFVGDKSQAQATLRCSFDNDNVYFLVEVLDKFLSKNDYADIYISSPTDNNLLSDGACRIRVAYDGLRSTEAYTNNWTKADLNVSVSAAYEGSIFDNSDEDYGYIAEISIPRSKLNIKSGEVLVNFSLFDVQGGEDAICSASSTNTAKWVAVTGL